MPIKYLIKTKNGERINSVRIEQKRAAEEEDEELPVIIENTEEFCYVCELTGDPEALLVCDHCNFKVCHTGCLPEPIDWVPEEDFYCVDCCAVGSADRRTII